MANIVDPTLTDPCALATKEGIKGKLIDWDKRLADSE